MTTTPRARIDFKPLRHGTDCGKVEHLGAGYLHDVDDDTPYDVDGLAYCGRCHAWLGAVLPADRDKRQRCTCLSHCRKKAGSKLGENWVCALECGGA